MISKIISNFLGVNFFLTHSVVRHVIKKMAMPMSF